MSLVSPKSVAVDEEGLVGRQDSHNGSERGGVSGPQRGPGNGNSPPSGPGVPSVSPADRPARDDLDSTAQLGVPPGVAVGPRGNPWADAVPRLGAARVPAQDQPLSAPTRGNPAQTQWRAADGVQDQKMQPYVPRRGSDPASAGADPTTLHDQVRADPRSAQQPGPGGWAPPGGSPADLARGAWATPPAAPRSPLPVEPTTGGTYGRASVPLNTVRPVSPASSAGAPPVSAAPGQPGGARPFGAVGGAAVGGGSGVSPGSAGSDGQPGAGAAAVTGDGDRQVPTGPVRKSRTKLISGLSVLVVLVLAAGVIGLVQPGPVKGWLGAVESSAPRTAATSPDPAPTPVLAAASGGGKQPSPDAVKAALDPLVNSAALGTTVHVAVMDVASNGVLYARNADIPTTPASTTKLLTASAVLAARGPAYRLSTTAVAGSEPGEVVLVGGGDPTLSVSPNALYPGAARLDQLATQVKKALGGTKPTRVLVDTSLFSGPQTGLGWDAGNISDGQVSRVQSLMINGGRIKPVHNEGGGDPRSSDPAIAAGKAFAKLLGVPAGTVARGTAPKAAPASAPTAPGARLGAVQSPPLVQITDWMLQESDNTVAEVLGRQVALAAGKPATFDNTSQATLDKLRDLGLPADEGDLYDASGLSRHDGISPTLLTETLALAASGRQPALTGIFSGLPVAGWSGTLADRFVKPSGNKVGQGVVRAKTGTLSGVNTMAGELVTKDGRLLVFAIMASGSSNAFLAKAALDKVPARLVTCGC